LATIHYEVAGVTKQCTRIVVVTPRRGRVAFGGLNAIVLSAEARQVNYAADANGRKGSDKGSDSTQSGAFRLDSNTNPADG